MSFTGVGGGDKEPRKFRFQVTPRVDIEAQSFHSSPSTPLSVDDPYTPNYFSPHLFKNLEDNEQTGQTQRTITLNNTATTTSTSSSSSFYNTIYKYNKLMQNDSNTSMEVLFRRPSNSPHSLVGIPFYNERIMVYNFIQRPTGLLAITYHTMVSLIVIFCLVLTILSTTSSKHALHFLSPKLIRVFFLYCRIRWFRNKMAQFHRLHNSNLFCRRICGPPMGLRMCLLL